MQQRRAAVVGLRGTLVRVLLLRVSSQLAHCEPSALGISGAGICVPLQSNWVVSTDVSSIAQQYCL